MTKLFEIEVETIVYLLLVIISTALFVVFSNKNYILQFRLGNQMVEESVVKETTAVVVKEPESNIENASQISPDGKKTLNLKTEYDFEKTTYNLSVIDNLTLDESTIYTEISTQSAQEKADVPFNTWSPDDKFVFIEKNKHTLVFQASGETFAEEKQYIDATKVFGEKITDYDFSVATGWASPTLLIINSVTKDGEKGPSYWLEVPSKAIYRLSTEF